MQPPDLNKPDPSGQPQSPYASGTPQNPPPPPPAPPVPPPYGGQSPYGGQQPPYGGQQPPYGGSTVPGAEKKMAAGICGILLGCLGVHKFILGYNTEGIIMLAVSLLTCGFGATIMAIVGIIEGVIYLTKTDQQFVQEYVVNKKGWL